MGIRWNEPSYPQHSRSIDSRFDMSGDFSSMIYISSSRWNPRPNRVNCRCRFLSMCPRCHKLQWAVSLELRRTHFCTPCNSYSRPHDDFSSMLYCMLVSQEWFIERCQQPSRVLYFAASVTNNVGAGWSKLNSENPCPPQDIGNFPKPTIIFFKILHCIDSPQWESVRRLRLWKTFIQAPAIWAACIVSLWSHCPPDPMAVFWHAVLCCMLGWR